MNRYVATFTALLLASSGLTSIQAQADHRDRTIKVRLPIHEHGQQTLKLRRMISRHTQMDLDGYRLKSVVLRSGRNSHGYASLRVGGRRSGSVFDARTLTQPSGRSTRRPSSSLKRTKSRSANAAFAWSITFVTAPAGQGNFVLTIT